MNRNTILIIIAIVGVLITGALIYANSNPGFSLPNISILGKSNDKLAKEAVDYINNNKLANTPASLVSVSEASGLVKVTIKIGTNSFDSYVTKDGKLLFPQAFEMAPKKADVVANQDAGSKKPSVQDAASVTKVDKPMLEAYVVARCPFGLQMQRAMAEAVKEQPALAQYIKAIYMGSVSSDGKNITAMHGAAEATENLRQICIREEQPTKYWDYVSCQMKAAGTEVSCEKPSGVDSAKLSACMSDPSKGVAYAKKDFDLNTKYGITGSPTLILNEAQISESGFGGRSADGVRAMVCAAFKTQPSFCSTKLNTAAAASSFSAVYSKTAAPADANADAAGCEAAQ